MEEYEIVKPLGDGSFGMVSLARSRRNTDLVAVKQFKQLYKSWQEVINLPEVKALRALRHNNIVKLIEVFREKSVLYMIFEYMQSNLYELMKDRPKKFSEAGVRNIMYQVLQGLAFMHKNGYFHRDLKPENILCSGMDNVKLADFGLAKEIRARPPFTDYVSTRWYRAPEVVLRSGFYGTAIDMWAVGTIMAEVYTLRPLCPGSSEIDQIFKISTVLGAPDKDDWEEGMKMAAQMRIKFPQSVAVPLKVFVPNATNEGIQMMSSMLTWNPKNRITASQALKRNYFSVGRMDAEAVEAAAAKQAAAKPKFEVKKFEMRPMSPTSDDDDFGIEDSPPPLEPVKKKTQWKASGATDFPTSPDATRSLQHGGLARDTSKDDIGWPSAAPGFGPKGTQMQSKQPLRKRDSVQSVVSNFSLSGANSSVSAANYYVAKSRYSPVSGGSKIPKSTLYSSGRTGPKSYASTNKYSGGVENKWRSRPSYANLGIGLGNQTAGADRTTRPAAGTGMGTAGGGGTGASQWRPKEPSLTVGGNMSKSRTDWSSKYGKK